MLRRVIFAAIVAILAMPQAVFAEDWQSALSQAEDDLRRGELDAAEQGFRNAEKLIEGAKAADKDELKKFGFSLVDCLVGISKVKDRKGEVSESISVYEMALETLKKFCENGWKNQEYANYLPGIIELYDKHGKAAEAEGAIKRLVEVRTTVAPKDDKQIIACYELYSKFLRAHQRPEEATPFETKVSQMKYTMQQ